jgi:glycine/D-amino acid oxidase-like deaminating enzyme
VTDHDAVVVGAGLAGLRAARVLAGHGLDVAVLEAGDRPGGRVASDVVDGHVLDRGFQVLNTSYPALRASVDLDALDLLEFVPGAAVRGPDGRLHTVGNPLRRPALAGQTLADGLLPARDKAALAAFTARLLLAPPARTKARIDRTAARDLAAAGLGGAVLDRFLRPFLSGVLGESELATSAAYVRLVWRAFALGTLAVPARGMGALPAALAAGLPLRTGVRVRRVEPCAGGVRVDAGDVTVSARAVVVATDPRSAADLLPGLPVPAMRTLTTYHHAATPPPGDTPLLHLDGTGGPIANTVAMPGRSVVASTVVGPALDEAVVRRELSRIHGVPTGNWELLRVDEITDALPAFPPGRALRSSVALGGGLFVAGDHRDTPSQQGALVSGRRAAQAVLAHLGAQAAEPDKPA